LQDARPFGLELVGQLEVALAGRDRDRERDQVEPPPDCLIDGTEPGLVIAGDEQLELRSVLEDESATSQRLAPETSSPRSARISSRLPQIDSEIANGMM